MKEMGIVITYAWRGKRRGNCLPVALCFLAAVVVSAGSAAASSRSQLLYARGLVPFQAQNWEAAYRLFDQAVRADPEDGLATYYRGLAAARLGLWNVALRDIEAAVRMRPDLPRAALDLGIVQFELGDYVSAEKWFEEASRQPCCVFSGVLFRGLTRYRLGDDMGAVEYLRRAEEDRALRPTARYYAALALLRAGQLERGRALLAELQAESPDSEVGRVAAQYLGQVPARRGVGPAERETGEKPWSVHAQMGFEYDSNVVLAPDDQVIRSTRSITEDADGRLSIGAGGRYFAHWGERSSLAFGYGFSQSVHFSLTEFDLQGHDLRLEVAAPWRGIEMGVLGGYGFYALNYRSFFQEGLASPWLTFFEGTRASTKLYYGLRGRDYLRAPFEPYLDSVNHAFGVRQAYSPGPNDILIGGYQVEYDDPVSADGGEFEALAHQVEVAYGRPVRDWGDVRAGYVFRWEDYQSVNSRTGTTLLPLGTREREDREHQVAFQFERRLRRGWTAGLSYVGTFNGSNIEAFEYDRHIAAVTLRYSF